MDKITIDEIKALDEIHHKFIYISQKMEPEIFYDKLRGVTTIEVSILEMVEKKPNIILKEIIEMLGVPSSTLTNAINRLEKKNLIRRVISQRDRRSFGLELTEEGKLAQKEHKDGEKVLYQKLLSPLSNEERMFLLQCLKKIIDSF